MYHYFRVWLQFIKLCIQRFIAYRNELFVWSLVSLGWTLFSLLFYEILFLHTNNLAGWSRQDITLFIGTYMIIDSATWGLFWGNIKMYAESIFSGSLDFILVKPIDPQFQLSIQHLSWTQVPRLIIGLYMILSNIHGVSLFQIALYVVLIYTSLLIIYLLWFSTTTLTFFAEKLDNITEIIPGLRRIWSIPSDVYSGPIAAILTILIPIGLITTTPSRVLLGMFAWKEIGILFLFTTIFFILTRKFFMFAIKRYSGVGS